MFDVKPFDGALMLTSLICMAGITSIQIRNCGSGRSAASRSSGGLQPKGPGHWSSGWLYDPQDGVTYDVAAEFTAPNTIFARVYRGIWLASGSPMCGGRGATSPRQGSPEASS